MSSQDINLDTLFNHKLDLKKSMNEMNVEPKFEFVKGSDYRKGYYSNNIVSTIYIRYYQIALFTDHTQQTGKRAIRSYLLKGESSKGACFFQYNIINIKDHKISEKKLDNFIKYLDNKNDTDIKVKYKFYPVYNFENINPPSGNELNECTSELLI